MRNFVAEIKKVTQSERVVIVLGLVLIAVHILGRYW